MYNNPYNPYGQNQQTPQTPGINIGVQTPTQPQQQIGMTQQEAQFIQGFYQSQFGADANQFMQQKMSEYMQSLQPQQPQQPQQSQVSDMGKQQDSDLSEVKEMLNSMLLMQEKNDSRLSDIESRIKKPKGSK